MTNVDRLILCCIFVVTCGNASMTSKTHSELSQVQSQCAELVKLNEQLRQACEANKLLGRE